MIAAASASPAAPPLDVARRLARLDRYSRLLDTAIRLPGGFRIGLDPILGLAPGIGDAVAGALSAYMVLEAYRLGVSRPALLRMVANIGIEVAVGSVPVLGDLFDAAFKANRRNMRIIDEHFRQGSRPLI